MINEKEVMILKKYTIFYGKHIKGETYFLLDDYKIKEVRLFNDGNIIIILENGVTLRAKIKESLTQRKMLLAENYTGAIEYELVWEVVILEKPKK